MPDLILESVRLPGGVGPTDLLIRDGRIYAYGSAVHEAEPTAERIGGGGRLVAPAFVEAHLHVEKALLLDRLPDEVRSVGEAIAATAALKRGFTRDDMRARAEQLLRMARRHGTLYVRAHVEVDPILGLSALEVALGLRETLAGLMTMQIVAFPQEGIQKSPGTEELLREALRLGADALGGAPYVDPDPIAHLDTLFRLALDAGVPLDLHADFSDDPPADPPGLTARYVAERAIAEGYLGRVVLGHATALGALPPEEIGPLAELLARADVSVVTLPATDLYLGGRSGHPQRAPGAGAGPGAPAGRGERGVRLEQRPQRVHAVRERRPAGERPAVDRGGPPGGAERGRGGLRDGDDEPGASDRADGVRRDGGEQGEPGAAGRDESLGGAGGPGGEGAGDLGRHG